MSVDAFIIPSTLLGDNVGIHLKLETTTHTQTKRPMMTMIRQKKRQESKSQRAKGPEGQATEIMKQRDNDGDYDETKRQRDKEKKSQGDKPKIQRNLRQTGKEIMMLMIRQKNRQRDNAPKTNNGANFFISPFSDLEQNYANFQAWNSKEMHVP
jgi:hypothetical protein